MKLYIQTNIQQHAVKLDFFSLGYDWNYSQRNVIDLSKLAIYL